MSSPIGDVGIRAGTPRSSTTSLVRGTATSQSSVAQTQLAYDSLKSLASRVVAYHFCQADNNITCMVPEFVHSLAAYMARSSLLTAYREKLLRDSELQTLLSVRNCLSDPSQSFIRGILEPLDELCRQGLVGDTTCVILIDALNEAAFHEPDYGFTITSFLSSHINLFPAWLKVIVTVRTNVQDIAKSLPFRRLRLEPNFASEDDPVVRDLVEYLDNRLNSSAGIRNNVEANTKSETARLAGHIASLSEGSLLYCKLLLDLIEYGPIVLKSTNYKVLPVNIQEIFLLQFNMRFQSVRAFERVLSILNICLATLYPLTAEEIYEAVNSGLLYHYIEWNEFLQRINSLAGFLIKRNDGTYMFFHPAFREWLIRREANDSNKFLCDLR